ncbi:patatin family protein [Clostridium sp. MT-14]|jgi:predicted patatin/cPLA2 family phospholipase|uniref:Patatin family protein n=1 Tax=Clostridium aromativorans TaxID=2836848 RepID=A0ABS8N4Q7_9CLOT|nr:MULTISPECIES: patatin family protein [Clostridium]KAA8667805.1 patatin family protein [Clostridium sp. HV4-5-A1G]MCC9294790.1 patatin family protein [Clostridium aromativorans]CAB1262251.1 NTE family protein RssA [Clostridiaceae bacterium BL-3]
MENIGLVLEGGGMRGLYTAGVLDLFMEKNLYLPYIIGVSMGACNACSYLSRQKGRNKRININYVDDPRYLSCRNLIFEKGIFGADFIFNEIPNKLEIFDVDTFNKSKEKFIVGTTDCDTGKPVYFEKNKCQDGDIFDAVRASSSLPFMASIVKFKGLNLLDGGISDPIPIEKSIKDGNKKNIIILTRNRDYVKKPFKMKFLARRLYSNYSGLVEAMINRHRKYNHTLRYIEKLRREGSVFVIRPKQPLKVKRIEKNKHKLTELYNQGYREALECYDKLEDWIKK